MKQLVLKQNLHVGQVFELNNESFHYLKNVRRIKLNDEIIFLCESGDRFIGQLTNLHDDYLEFLVKSQIENTRNKDFNLTLFQCLPKGKKMEQIIRQAAEAGVKTLVPIQSEYSIPQFKNPADFEKKRTRWQKIAQEAAQQSGSLSIMQIKKLLKIKEIVADDFDTKLYAHIDSKATSLHNFLMNCQENIALLIGPEGGLSNNDRETLDRADFFPVYLGQSILRVESAGLFLLGAVKMILLEKESWRIN